MKRIKLTRGQFASVDDKDYDRVNQCKWFLEQRKNIAYAYKTPNKNCSYKSMHRLVMNAQKGQQIDHRDGDGLNNQRSNLRFSTQSQNMMNQRKTRGTSKYKGVKLYRDKKTWVASIMRDYKTIHIGYFKDEPEAARAYDAKAVELFGEFARLNFPPAGLDAYSLKQGIRYRG